jgi:hypothetical protein
MDYFYNSTELNSRSKLSDKEKLELNEYIFSILELYTQYIESRVDILISPIINQSYLLKIGFNLLITDRIFENEKDSASQFYILNKIIKIYILSGNYRGLVFIKKVIIIEFFKGIEKQNSISILKEKILSLCGEKFRRDYLIFEKSMEESDG